MMTLKPLRTKSIPRAAFLIMRGIEPVRTEKFNDRTCFWLFPNEPRTHEALADYDNGSGEAQLIHDFLDARSQLLRLAETTLEGAQP